jgi:hypothetical protein
MQLNKTHTMHCCASNCKWLHQLATLSLYTLIVYSFDTFSQIWHIDDIAYENKEIITFTIIL